MVGSIQNMKEFNSVLKNEDAALFYFSHEECNVCKVLKPKVDELLELEFPRIKMYYVNTMEQPEIAGQQRIFAVPTIVVYFAGREYIRKSRNIGLSELRMELSRPYSMMFLEEED